MYECRLEKFFRLWCADIKTRTTKKTVYKHSVWVEHKINPDQVGEIWDDIILYAFLFQQVFKKKESAQNVPIVSQVDPGFYSMRFYYDDQLGNLFSFTFVKCTLKGWLIFGKLLLENIFIDCCRRIGGCHCLHFLFVGGFTPFWLNTLTNLLYNQYQPKFCIEENTCEFSACVKNWAYMIYELFLRGFYPFRTQPIDEFPSKSIPTPYFAHNYLLAKFRLLYIKTPNCIAPASCLSEVFDHYWLNPSRFLQEIQYWIPVQSSKNNL